MLLAVFYDVIEDLLKVFFEEQDDEDRQTLLFSFSFEPYAKNGLYGNKVKSQKQRLVVAFVFIDVRFLHKTTII